jgi:ATPase family protein associated with various cellular activities (AAA)/AAA+ lid domain-containing protein
MSTRPSSPPDPGAGPRPFKAAKVTMPEIEVHIRARYPLLYIVSWEERRVIEEIDGIAARLKKHVYRWTFSGGIQRLRHAAASGGFGTEERRGTRDPIACLREIATISEPSVFILTDFHAFLKERDVARTLRDLASVLHATNTTVVILSPLLQIPSELEKDITIIDFPLPGKEEIRRLIENIAADIHGNPSLSIESDAETLAAIEEAAVGLTLTEVENVFAKVLVQEGRLTREQVPLIYAEKKQIIRKSGLLEYYEVSEQMDSVGGLQGLKGWLAKRRLAFSEKARSFGLPIPKGVLFIGVQGCGKSLVAKACSTLWQMPLLRLDMGQLFGSYIGESEANIRRAIIIAESIAPVILWADEIDKGMAGMRGGDTDSGTTARVLGTLVTWLQEKSKPVFVIATANDITRLPPELIRKGRFDEIFFVDLPNRDERHEIFRVHLAKRGRDASTFDLDALSGCSEGMSGAEIEQAVISAMFNAFHRGEEITTDAVIHAMATTMPLSQTMKEDIDGLRQWAEGRAVSASVPMP